MSRLLRNSAFNFTSQALSVLVGVVCVPVIFRLLDQERFGLLTLVWSTLSYSIAFDFGTGPAVARAAAASLVQDGGRRVRAILRAGILLQLAIGILIGLVIFLLAPWLVRLIRIPAAFAADARLAMYVLAATIPITLINQSQTAVLEALERFDLIAYVRTPMQMATYVLPAVGAVAGWSLATIILGILVSRTLGALFLRMLSLKYLAEEQSGSVRTELPGLFKFGRWLAISGLLAQLITYIDRFLLSGMHGLAAVAQYGAPYDATAKLLVLPGSVGVAMFPGLAKDNASGQATGSLARTRAAGRTTMMILLPICLIAFAFADQLLHLWLGPAISHEGVTAFRILLVATLFHAAAYPPLILIEASGRPDVVARYSLVELIVYLPVVIVAIAQYGVAGAAVAWALRTFALMVWSSWYANKH